MAQNKQIRSLAERAEITSRILPKRTFDLKSGYWIFLTNKFCMIFFNTRLQLAEEKNRVFFEQVSGKEWNFDFFPYRTKKTFSICVHFGHADDDTFSLFGGIYSPSSCWESCWVNSQWNFEHFPFFYFIDYTSESWEKLIFVNTTLGGWPSSQQSHHSPSNDQNHNGIMGQL